MMERKKEVEGGCGVIGTACTEKIAGRHLLPALCQMDNRGNGKGGGIAAAGLSPRAFGVSKNLLESDYLLAIAYLDRSCQTDLEKQFIHSIFHVHHVYEMPHIPSYKSIKDLQVAPPEAVVYFVRVKEEVLQQFREVHCLQTLSLEALEDEVVYQNTYHLNQTFYSATHEKRAFVLSHGKNLLVLKMVGFGNDVIRYYQLEDFEAHVWIGHHRYPTKGRVWHPGGAHPFIGMHEALVHNGDFANYFSLCEYLSQRNIKPLFLTDTEVSVLIFDLLHRTYQYPLEYVIEAMAPTTEWDFTRLPEEKQNIYKMLQKTHIHGSPDGPWFFLIAQSLAKKNQESIYRLIGITDTSMLRPQVFAWQQGAVSIGFSASEKQAIDAVLKSLSEEDSRYWSHADKYWSARGGSYTDGGAFSFSVNVKPDEEAVLTCTNKFGEPVLSLSSKPAMMSRPKGDSSLSISDHPEAVFREANYDQAWSCLSALVNEATNDQKREKAIVVLTQLMDQYYPLKQMKRSCLLALLSKSFSELMEKIGQDPGPSFAYLSLKSPKPVSNTVGETLVINATGFPAEGEQSLALEIVGMYKKGFRKMIVYNCQGQRFIGNGLGPKTESLQIDVYGSSGDYLGSGIDGATITVHASGQDQLAQIMNEGTLVVHGDVGQTFMYAAKGGSAFVRGNAAGRPLINAVGKPRVVINGTCLDYLAESFMAGNPLKDGGFVVINGLRTDEDGEVQELETPYPGNNLFSLASGGAIYLRDPGKKITEEQLNGGEFTEMTLQDWELLLPYLKQNEKLFQISVNRLLEYMGKESAFNQIYRKIVPSHVRVLQAEEAWVKSR